MTAAIFSIGKCSAWCEAHTTHRQSFVFLPSHFLVFLRLVSLALSFFFFCYLGFTYLFALSHVASEQPEMSDYQRFNPIQWVSFTISALRSSSQVCCTVHRLIRIKYFLCIYTPESGQGGFVQCNLSLPIPCFSAGCLCDKFFFSV